MSELTEARRESLLAYCRIDALEPGDEALLASFYYSAVGYMEAAGVSEPPEGTPRRAQYDLCVNSIVLDGWDNRGTEIAAKAEENPAFRRTLNQLKLAEPGGDGWPAIL